jgi:hypothetical protein
MRPGNMQIVDLRYDDPPAARGYADRDQRQAYLQRREAARAAQTAPFVVSLECAITMPDGTQRMSLEPVEESEFHAREWRRLLAEGLITERYGRLGDAVGGT